MPWRDDSDNYLVGMESPLLSFWSILLLSEASGENNNNGYRAHYVICLWEKLWASLTAVTMPAPPPTDNTRTKMKMKKQIGSEGNRFFDNDPLKAQEQ